MNMKTKKALSASTIASLLITSSIVSVNVKAASVTPPESPRLWGADRYETAVKVSQAGWTSGSDYAVIASGEGYADALCAAPLAKVNNAPILLTEKGTLNQKTLDELKRLKVKHVFIIGGQGVVSQAVEDAIKANVTSDIQRLWGQNRYETSVKVAEKLGTPSKIVLASGEGYADALSAAPVAAIEGMPILLTESKTLSKATSDYIKANTGITKTYVIGGYASVSEDAMNATPSPQRFWGADRFETNAAVITGFSVDFDFKNVYVALGNGPVGNEFADALTASAIAAKNKNPLIIVGKELSSATQALMKAKLTASSTITVLGGEANVSDSLVSQIKTLAPSTTAPAGGGGGSSSGSTSNITYLSQAGTYSSAITGDAHITASNVILTAPTVSGNLYIDNGANNTSVTGVTVSGVTVSGTVYVNPGADGVVVLNNVKASNIVIQSGAPSSIDLNNVTADTLEINSTSNVHVKSQGTTNIKSTTIKSQVILDASAGSFGDITIPQIASANNTVTLRGSFDRAITIQGNVNLQAEATATVPAIVIPATVTDKGIIIGGSGTIGSIQVRSSNAKLSMIGNVVVPKGILTAPGSSVDLDGSTTKPTVTTKNESDSWTDVTSCPDITGLVSTVYTNKIADSIKSHPTLVKDISVDVTKNPIVVTLLNENLRSLSTVFNNVQKEDTNLLIARLTKAEELMDLHSTLFNINGAPFKQYLAQADDKYMGTGGSSKYFIQNTDGTYKFDTAAIAARMQSTTNPLTYDLFKADMKARVEAMIDKTKISPTISITITDGTKTYSTTVSRIAKDGVAVYDSLASRESNIENLMNFGDTTTGTYTITTDLGCFTVKVQ